MLAQLYVYGHPFVGKGSDVVCLEMNMGSDKEVCNVEVSCEITSVGGIKIRGKIHVQYSLVLSALTAR